MQDSGGRILNKEDPEAQRTWNLKISKESTKSVMKGSLSSFNNFCYIHTCKGSLINGSIVHSSCSKFKKKYYNLLQNSSGEEQLRTNFGLVSGPIFYFTSVGTIHLPSGFNAPCP